MIEWALIYWEGNGELSFFTNDDGGPEEAPRLMVLASAHVDERVGWVTEVSDPGWWGWRSDLGRWKALHDHEAKVAYELTEPWPLKVLGWELDDDAWSRVLKEAEDAMKKPKTGWRRRERRII